MLMKAIVYTAYGPPEVIQLKEIAKPVPKNNEVLIKVYATTVTSVDTGMRGYQSLSIHRNPLKSIPGFDIAGEVEAIGKNVKRFSKGDQVYGYTGIFKPGACAEYKCMPEKGVLAIKPTNITFEEAAAVPYSGLTALPFLRDKGKIRKGHKVLIFGASGAIGTSAIQLAKYFGAEVIGVCSSANLELVKSLGADNVIDYTKNDFTQNSQTYNIILDAVGKSSFSRCKGSLSKNGVYLSVMPQPADILQMLWTSIGGRKKIRFAATAFRSARKATKDLIFLKELIEAGKIRAVIDRRYPLEQTAEAHRYVDKGRKKGNVVITVGHSNKSE
jgi:NADPH:quinone reductase-like Zn-dependent oxidoreductase